MTELIIPTKDGKSFTAYVAMPSVTPAPVVIMIQEIFGVNHEMRQKCDEMAAKGFIAISPDLFWRLEPGVQLTDKSQAEWDKAFDLMNRFDIDQGIDDLRAVYHTMRGHAQGNGMVGCVGYCLGGRLAYLMAARSNVDASVGYYGVGLDALLGEAKNISHPLMLHIAGEDKFSNKEAQKKIVEGLHDNPLVTVHVYPGVDHAFARGNGEHYDENAAHEANARTFEFLQNNLKHAKAA